MYISKLFQEIEELEQSAVDKIPTLHREEKSGGMEHGNQEQERKIVMRVKKKKKKKMTEPDPGQEKQNQLDEEVKDREKPEKETVLDVIYEDSDSAIHLDYSSDSLRSEQYINDGQTEVRDCRLQECTVKDSIGKDCGGPDCRVFGSGQCSGGLERSVSDVVCYRGEGGEEEEELEGSPFLDPRSVWRDKLNQ